MKSLIGADVHNDIQHSLVGMHVGISMFSAKLTAFMRRWGYINGPTCHSCGKETEWPVSKCIECIGGDLYITEVAV